MHIADKPADWCPFPHLIAVNAKILRGPASKQETFFWRIAKISTFHFRTRVSNISRKKHERKRAQTTHWSPSDREATSSSAVEGHSLNQAKPSNFLSPSAVIKTNRPLRCNFLLQEQLFRSFCRPPTILLCGIYCNFNPNIWNKYLLCLYTHVYTLIWNIGKLITQ